MSRAGKFGQVMPIASKSSTILKNSSNYAYLERSVFGDPQRDRSLSGIINRIKWLTLEKQKKIQI
jgi:hypothetical protein